MATRRYDFITGIESSDAPVATDPVNPSDPTTLGFSDARYAQGAPGVADITALKALDVSLRRDKDIVLVEAKNAVYRYDATGSGTNDDNFIVSPNAGSGRWFRVSDLDSSGNLVVPGNLTVSGTTTTVNSETLDVVDPQITVNKGGNESSAHSNQSGIKVEMSDATDAILAYRQSLQSQFVAGTTSFASEILTNEHTQFIVGQKTFATKPIRFQNIGGTPTTPPSGHRELYSTSTGFKQIDDAGIISELGGGGGGSGSGEINVIASSSTATDWVASGAGVTVATTSTTAELPLEGVITTGIKITPVSGTDYVRYRFSMPDALLQTKLKIQWYQKALSGYTSGDLKVEMYVNDASDYSGSYTEVALSTDASGTSSIPALDGKYTTTFDSDDNVYYELRIVRTAGTTALVLSSLIVGPGVQPQGAIVGDWISYTPSGSQQWTTNATFSAFYRRIGNAMELRGKITFTGVPSGGGNNHFIALPTGLNIDTSIIETGAQRLIGRAKYQDTGTGSFSGVAIFDGSTTDHVRLLVENAASTNTSWQSSSTTVPYTIASGDLVEFEAVIPIAQWSGNGTVNLAQNDVEYAWNSSTADATDTTSFGYGPLGATFNYTQTTTRERRVRFPTPFQAGESIAFEWQQGGTGPWIEIPISGGAASVAGVISPYTGSTVGFYLINVSGSSTDVNVGFARYATGTTNWSTNFSTTRWRLKKVKAGAAVGFGAVSASSSGLMPANHSNLDDAAATRLGLKSYSHGTTYNGGNAPTITGPSGLSVTRSKFIPYQLQDLTWRMRFAIEATFTSTTSGDFSVAGINFLGADAISSYAGSTNTTRAATSSGTSTIIFRLGSASTGGSVSGDVDLSSKPTWAY